MFQCQFCKTVVPPHTPRQRIVTEIKQIQYPARPRAHRYAKHSPPEKGKQFCTDKGGKWRGCACCDHGGVGFGIAKELSACPACAERYGALPPKLVGQPLIERLAA